MKRWFCSLATCTRYPACINWPAGVYNQSAFHRNNTRSGSGISPWEHSCYGLRRRFCANCQRGAGEESWDQLVEYPTPDLLAIRTSRLLASLGKEPLGRFEGQDHKPLPFRGVETREQNGSIGKHRRRLGQHEDRPGTWLTLVLEKGMKGLFVPMLLAFLSCLYLLNPLLLPFSPFFFVRAVGKEADTGKNHI